MTKLIVQSILGGLLVLANPSMSLARSAVQDQDDSVLSATIAELDAKVFDAYNRCDLAAFGAYFSPKVEFYHDKGGATFDRRTVIANTRKYICHKVFRELITGSLRIYPIKDFGAVEEGEHRFCQIGGECEGAAKFLMIWHSVGKRWEMTRVVSFGHRSLTDAEKSALGR